MLMAAIRLHYLDALAENPDLEEQKKIAAVITFITKNFLSEEGIMQWLIDERKALLEQQNSEAELEGSPYMESDSSTFDVED